MKILLVEDDESLGKALEKLLTQQNFVVDRASDGQVGWEFATALNYDLIILDIQLPKLNGIQFCQQLRARKDHTPILLLTAYDSSKGRIQGLDAGADDYLAKPFDSQELLARIRSLLRRSSPNPLPLLEWGKLTLDRNLLSVTYDGQPIQLTPKEYGLLELFLSNKNRILDYDFFVDRLWIAEALPTENVIRAHIKRLRHKLKQAGAEDIIETVYGLGYRLTSRSQAVSLNSTKNYQELDSLWKQYQQSYLNRLNTVDEVIQALEKNTFDLSLHRQAQQQIHTLIGSVGSFGLERASQLGRSLERLLLNLNINPPNPAQIKQLSDLVRALRQELEHPSTHLPDLFQPKVLPQTAPKSRLLIIEDDLGLAERLATEARTQGFWVDIATNVSQARAEIAQHRPDIVLLDLYLPDTPTQGYVLLAELSAATPAIPVIVLTAQETFADRVQVARLGGLGFLAKPVTPPQVMQAIAQVLQQSHTPEATILIVDDDPQLLDRLQHLLKPWGFHLTLLDDPQQFWQTLEQVQPDLLILNVEMPELSGIDLCQVVRNDLRWQHLPIVFLSAHQDETTIQRIFAAGADDFVPKPIAGSELVTRILNRLKRNPFQKANVRP